MRRGLLDILACPIDRHHPLELHECRAAPSPGDGGAVAEGALYCGRCTRFFAIIDGIPIMLPDDLRDKRQEIEFLERNSGRLPDKITRRAAPWHL